MSGQAMIWAGRQECGSPAAKLILLAYAFKYWPNSKDDGKLFPGRQWLCEWTGLSKNSIAPGIKKLCNRKLLIDTGERRGASQRITVYRIAYDPKADDPNCGQSDGTKCGQSDGPRFDGDSPQSDQRQSANWPEKGQNRDPSLSYGNNEYADGVGPLPANPFLTVGAV